MKILLVATKPPWPLIDGGRLLLWHTIAGLARHGAEITLVAPVDAGSNCEAVGRELRMLCRPMLVTHPRRMRLRAFAHALAGGAPVSIALHRFAAMRERVGALLASEAFDLVHAEQLQAVANCDDAGFSNTPASTFLTKTPAIPLVLRSQNVESDLWRRLADYRPALRPLLLREARRLGVWEAQAVRRSNVTIALTRRDAEQLAALANESGEVRHAGKVHHVPAPFPAELAPGRAPALAGVPPVVLFGGAGWLPNREGERWFIREVWPAVSERLPDAVLHIFGSVSAVRGRINVVTHASPSDSSAVFAAGTVLVVPLRVASGLRMKILEAWARGIPVVATPEAAAGLEAADGSELLLARDAIAFAFALESLARSAELREGVVRRARALLLTNHDPATVTRRMLAVYRQVLPQAVSQELTGAAALRGDG
jgi:glycosyltransferase involved in cell wall biosynthesis